MTTAPWPDHLLTLEEWDALPEEVLRQAELVEGVVVMVPSPTSLHQRAGVRLAMNLDNQLPDDLTALTEVEVLVDANHPATVRKPDVIITTNKLAEQDQYRFAPADVLLAVEIMSPGSVRRDRVLKLVEYADAGIPNYWIIELGEPNELAAYLLVDGDYEIVARTSDAVTLSSPAVLTVDVRTLTSRR